MEKKTTAEQFDEWMQAQMMRPKNLMKEGGYVFADVTTDNKPPEENLSSAELDFEQWVDDILP